MALLRNNWFRIFLLIPFFETRFIRSIDGLNTIFNLWLVIDAGITIYYAYRNRKISLGSICLVAIALDILLSTVFHNGYVQGAVENTGYLAIFSILIDILSKHVNIDDIIYSILQILELWNIFNFISLYLGKNEGRNIWDTYYFFGNKNQLAMYILPMILYILLLYSRGKIYSKTHIISIIIGVFSMIQCKSANTLVVTILLLIGFAVYACRNKMPKLFSAFNIYTYYIIYLILFTSIIIFRVQKNSIRLQQFLTITLQKDIGFNTRTLIWDNAIKGLKSSPIIGCGIEKSSDISSLLGHSEAHNIILDYAFKGGFIAIAFFCVYLLLISRKLFKYRKSKYSFLISLFVFLLLITNLVESFLDSVAFMSILIIACKIRYFISPSINTQKMKRIKFKLNLNYSPRSHKYVKWKKSELLGRHLHFQQVNT